MHARCSECPDSYQIQLSSRTTRRAFDRYRFGIHAFDIAINTGFTWIKTIN
ncbi:hypothetical protein Hanom_Chr05g00425751 [Helianthus anomalus]